MALYDSRESYGLIRLLPNALAKLEEVSCSPIVLDDKGRRLACIGPSEFVITVFDARSLDEVSVNKAKQIFSIQNPAGSVIFHVVSYTCRFCTSDVLQIAFHMLTASLSRVLIINVALRPHAKGNRLCLFVFL